MTFIRDCVNWCVSVYRWTTTDDREENGYKKVPKDPVRTQSTLVSTTSYIPLLPTLRHAYTHLKMSSSNSMQFLPRSCSLATLIFLVVMAVLAVYVTSAQADGGDVMSGGEGGEMTAMADAIKYLQGLDKVYGQAARPSIRGGKIVQLLQLKQLDRRYDNSLVRPRFGKRGRLPYFDLEDLPLHPQHAY